MRYVSSFSVIVLVIALVAAAGCTTELRINGKPVEIPYVVFEVTPPTAKVAASSRLQVRFKSIDGLATGPIEARLDDPTDLFEIDRSECKTLHSNEVCSVMVSFNADECTVGKTAEPRAKLVIQSENAGLATAELVGQCGAAGNYITAQNSAR